jgi:thymidylate kinase
MFTVALVGPDGVGKTTIARQLEQEFPLPLKYLYMGDNIDSSNTMLPTTRWWKTRQRRQATTHQSRNGAASQGMRSTRGNPLRRGTRAVRKTLGFVNRVFEESYRELVAVLYVWRGYIVLFDRHFALDYYHFDIDPEAPPRSFKRRLHGLLLKRICREPDLVICLDAPGEVVFARKGEFSPDFLEKRRHQYRDFGGIVKNFQVVDADRELPRVIGDVSRTIATFHERLGNGSR